MSDFNAEHQKMAAAVATLESMKYTWNGGVHWKPPLGKKPDFDLLDQKQADFDQLANDYYKVIQERDALTAGAAFLINQVEMGIYTDEQDHNLKNNQAFVFLKGKLNDPKGFMLVPVEPTGAMVKAGSWNNYAHSLPDNHVIEIYKAMIQAAQEND